MAGVDRAGGPEIRKLRPNTRCFGGSGNPLLYQLEFSRDKTKKALVFRRGRLV